MLILLCVKVGSSSSHVSLCSPFETRYTDIHCKSHLEDCDVELLSREDLSEEELGALPRAEESQFFMVICDLCLIIGEWLDLLRPGKVRYAPKHGPGSQVASSPDQDRKVQRTRELVAQMSTWHQQLPAILKSPEDCAGFSLWSATIHIAYCAAMLRFHLLLR